MRLADGSACIRTRFLLCGDISNLVTRDRRRSGRPRVTSLRQDTYIRVTHLRNRLQTAALTARSIPGLRNISLRTVRNCLRERNIRPQRPAIRLVLQRRHRVARLAWCRAHLCFTRRDWARILFSDESSFHLDSSDGRSGYTVKLENGTRITVVERRLFGGGSIMVWGGITGNARTPLVVINGNLTCARYRDEILQAHIVPFVRQHAVTLQHDHWTDFNIILQKCSFGGPLPRLFQAIWIRQKTWPPRDGAFFPYISL